MNGGVSRLGAAAWLLAASLLPGAPALAQAAGDDAARQAVAREVVALNGFAHAYAEALTSMQDRVIASVETTYGKSHDDARRIVASVVIPALRAHVGELADSLAALYVQDLTLDELKQLRDFFHTPVGQKYARVYPDLMVRMSAAQHDWWQRVTKQAMQALAETAPGRDSKM